MAADRLDRRRLAGGLVAGLLALGLSFAILRAGYIQPLFELGLVLLLVVSTAYLLWHANPAVTLSGAFVLSCLSGHWAAAGWPLGGTVAPDRVMLLGGVVAVALRGPWMRGRPPLRVNGVYVILLAALVYAAGSAIVSGTFFQQAAFFRLAEAFGAGPFALFVFAPYAFAQRRQRDILLVALVGFGTYLGITAVFELAHFQALIFPSYINDPNIGIHYGRARGPFTEAVTNGTALYACAVACAIAAWTWTRRGPRLYAASVGVLCFVGTFLTFQRSVWLSVVVATGVAAMVTPPLRRFLPTAVLAGTLIIAALLVASPALRDKATQRKNDVGTVHDRENLNRAALNMVEARPLFGFGWEEFTTRSGNYFQQAFDYPLSANGLEVHNLYLGYAAGLGLIGLLLWAGGLLAALAGALRTRGPPDMQPWRAGLVAIAVFFAIVSAFVPPQVFPNLLLWLWIAVVWSSRLPARPPGASVVAAPGPIGDRVDARADA